MFMKAILTLSTIALALLANIGIADEQMQHRQEIKQNEVAKMSLEENKQLVRRFYEAIERGDFDALHDMVHPDFVFYNQVDVPRPGVAGLVEAEKKNFDAFESFRFPIETLVAEGDKVAAYMLFEGKGYRNDVFGVPPTGKDVRISLMMLLTIKGGKIIEKRAHFDVGDVRRQLSP